MSNYSSRLWAFVTAPVSGAYTFWIASDDNGELYLSTSLEPADKVLIARVDDWTSYRQWDKYTSQQSEPVELVAGQSYYLEALHKEGEGGNNLSIGWAVPGGDGGPVVIGPQHYGLVQRGVPCGEQTCRHLMHTAP